VIIISRAIRPTTGPFWVPTEVLANHRSVPLFTRADALEGRSF